MVDLEDDFIIGAKKAVSKRNYDKNDQRACISYFKKYFVDEFKIDTLLQSCVTGEIEKISIRATLWKILLGILPQNQNYAEWIDSTTKQRNIFKSKLKTFTNLKKLSGDPLGGLNDRSTSNDGWNSFFRDNELRKLITLDISRTYQDKDLFQNTAIKDLLINILFIWAKENAEPSYRQGMNEILAVLLFAVYPFYFTFERKSFINTNNIQSMKRDEKFSKELYYFLYDEDELQADLYSLFDSLMKRGVISFYSSINDDASRNSDKDTGKKKDLLLSQNQENENVPEGQKYKEVSPLQRRCNKIYIDYLKVIDQELHNYLVKIDVNPTLFLVRWLKCLLNREFHYKDVIVLLDAILANDLQEKLYEEKSSKIILDNLNMLDYLCVSMITYIREDILRRDHVECLQRLFKYPPLESPITLIKMAVNIKSVILRKLIFNQESNNTSTTVPKSNSSNQIYQRNYDNNKITSTSGSHPLDKPKSENISPSNLSKNTNANIGLLHGNNQPNTNETTTIKITNIDECIKKLEKLSDKYKEKIESRDLEEFNRILDFLRKNK